MLILTLASVLTGMALGLRFKVLSVIPAIIVAALLGVTVAMDRGGGLWIIAALVLNVVAVQMGYLCGTFAQAMLRESRTAPAPMADYAAVSSSQAAKAYNPQNGVGISLQ